MSLEKPIDKLLGDLLLGDNGQPRGSAHVILPGKKCLCGPDFCASEKGVGFSGYCRGKRDDVVAAPDCPICKAPHQSADGCWLCSRADGNDPKNADIDLAMLDHGVHLHQIFDRQEAMCEEKGGFVSMDEALQLILADRGIEWSR